MRTDDPFIQSVKDARSRIESMAATIQEINNRSPVKLIGSSIRCGQRNAYQHSAQILNDLLRSYGINPEED